MNKQGLLIVYSGPSGVGKGTLMVPYLKENPDSVLSVSMTTRPPRPGETDGVEYYFVTREQFLEKIAAGGLLEYAEYNGQLYGTPREPVERKLAEGINVVLEIEVQGAMQIKASFPQAVFIFVMPPSRECLRQRLMGRGTETPEVVEGRLAAARRELMQAREYDYIIINDQVEAARERLASVIRAAACESRFQQNFIDKVCEPE